MGPVTNAGKENLVNCYSLWQNHCGSLQVKHLVFFKSSTRMLANTASKRTLLIKMFRNCSYFSLGCEVMPRLIILRTSTTCVNQKDLLPGQHYATSREELFSSYTPNQFLSTLTVYAWRYTVRRQYSFYFNIIGFARLKNLIHKVTKISLMKYSQQLINKRFTNYYVVWLPSKF